MELYQNRILYQGEILIFHDEDLLVVAFPDTLYAVYQCNYQGVRIIYTPALNPNLSLIRVRLEQTPRAMG